MSKRTIEELRSNLNGKIHIYLKDTKTAMQFLIDAENEGYLLWEKKPTEEKIISDIISLEYDKKIAYATWAGHICFQSNGGDLAAQGKYHRIDYAKYISGEEDYFVKEEYV